MSFRELLKTSGWTEDSPYQFRKGNWRVVFDTSAWIEVGTEKSPRIFDVPIPEAGMEQWTLNLIHHLCNTDDALQMHKGTMRNK